MPISCHHMQSFPLYQTLFPLLAGVAQGVKALHPQIAAFFEVRQHLFTTLQQQLATMPNNGFRLWVHAASVGEFEQARPIIAALQARHPNLRLFISFLSPSGYNARKNFPNAAAVFYLPLDTAANARKLVALLKPDALLLMRYDFWPNHLLAAKKYGTTLVLAAAVLQPQSAYFNPLLRRFYKKLFHLFNAIYTVAERDTQAFKEHFGYRNAITAGDPRFDQVVARSRNRAAVANLRAHYEGRKVLVAGSVWEADEQLLIAAWQELNPRPSLIVVPHQTEPEKIAHLCSLLDERNLSYARISTFPESFQPEQQILIIDQIGYLAELYSIASIAYVGGGFGVNVHNTLEPAVYAIPVLFGPNHHNSPEAAALLEAGGATVVQQQSELHAALQCLCSNESERQRQGSAAGTFVQARTGATAMVVEYLEGVANVVKWQGS
uniref:3-deoxy-D-manno-octulosonic acid transferase n=1 Tax=Chlorobium chlorochromatii (strain CaD3) TaxID=340177 RepID=Q3ARJ8_CHLCH